MLISILFSCKYLFCFHVNIYSVFMYISNTTISYVWFDSVQPGAMSM